MDTNTTSHKSNDQAPDTNCRNSAAGDSRRNAYLIVNADDYGRFACVSRGIIDAAVGGIVTATGILANENSLNDQLRWLDSAPDLDKGVHLTLSSGHPLTRQMRQRLIQFGGRFPNKFKMMMAIVSGAVTPADVLLEWTAQIDRLLSFGICLSFVNSHEHLHMLPPLYRITLDLANRFGIEHVRHVMPNHFFRFRQLLNARDLLLAALGIVCRSYRRAPEIAFEGLANSGCIDSNYLQGVLKELHQGSVYELMCHPGRFDPMEITDPGLRAYHQWEGELKALTSLDVVGHCRNLKIRLIRFRDLRSLPDPISFCQKADSGQRI